MSKHIRENAPRPEYTWRSNDSARREGNLQKMADQRRAEREAKSDLLAGDDAGREAPRAQGE
jgi:hypothetical protein